MGLGFNKLDFCKYNKLENLTTNPYKIHQSLTQSKKGVCSLQYSLEH